MTAEPPRLEIRNLTRSFAGREVVRGVSLKVAAGQVTCLLGPSGCGKSTTLRIIAGVDSQDTGELYIDGELICGGTTFVPPEARSVGLMFQDFALFPHLSVADNVAFGLTGSRAENRKRADELLERVGLGTYGDAFPHELSGGEQQRVALARAIAPRPRILLMDEPFLGPRQPAARRHSRRDPVDPQGRGHGGPAGHPRTGRGHAHGRRDRPDA